MPSHQNTPGHDPSPGRLLPDRRAALLIGACGLALLLALLFLAVRGDDHSSGSDSGSRALPVVGHVHGIGADPADGTVYVGAHFGVFSVTEAGEARPVGEERNDTMAFTVVGPGHFVASGHPDVTTGGPVHLGLIESRDAAQSWQSRSLSGAADFHGTTWAAAGRVPGTPSALEVTPTRWYAASDAGFFSSEDQGDSWDAWFTYDGAS